MIFPGFPGVLSFFQVFQVEWEPWDGKGSFTQSNSVTVTKTNVALMGKMGMQPILPITVPIKKIKGATRQCYGNGVIRCEQTLTRFLPPSIVTGELTSF